MKVDVKEQLGRLAKHIVDRAVQKDTSFPDSVAAFKELTTYYGLVLKHRGKTDDEEDEETFGAFSDQINEPQEPVNGAAKLRSRAGRARASAPGEQ